jgi:tRNA A64-2'-O-ribosylphosphate transferase
MSTTTCARAHDDDGEEEGAETGEGGAFGRLSDDALNASLSPSIYALARAIKKSAHGAFHCAHSIAVDAAFVDGVVRARGFHGKYPCFANARAGTWYAASTAREGDGWGWDGCYFKSTDGHNNNWAFSRTRLNERVAHEAAKAGGCVIVDATRSSVKRFPDALSKTVPIWADTLNRACAAADAEKDPAVWCDGPYFPDWVAEHERNSIRARVGEFEASFRSVEWDVGELAKKLRKPFRCVWLSRGEDGADLSIDSLEREDFTPLVLITASAPLHWRGGRRVGVNGHSFCYIPGAGDDEESWANGLTSADFHAHREALLDIAESRFDTLVDRIVSGRVTGSRSIDPRSRFAAKGCSLDADAMNEANRTLGLVSEGAVRELSPECALGACYIGSFAMYDRSDAAALADGFLHVGETAVDAARVAPSTFLHVPVKKAKVSRLDLLNSLPRCLKFIRETMKTPGARLCVTCDDGVDHAVAVAVAASIAMTSEEDSSDVTKDLVRQRLAVVARTHPDAQPTRGSLKQVYNYFESHK